MSASVHPLNVDPGKAREHITLPVEAFSDRMAELLADAEDKGTRAALYAAPTTPERHLAVLSVMEETHERRVRLYAAIVRATIRGLGA